MEKKKLLDITLNVDELRKQKRHFIEGKKGTYLDLRMIELENKQYNDFMVVVKVSKQDYEQGVKGDIVGYGKDWSLRDNNQGGGGAAPAAAPSSPNVEADDLPF